MSWVLANLMPGITPTETRILSSTLMGPSSSYVNFTWYGNLIFNILFNFY